MAGLQRRLPLRTGLASQLAACHESEIGVLISQLEFQLDVDTAAFIAVTVINSGSGVSTSRNHHNKMVEVPSIMKKWAWNGIAHRWSYFYFLFFNPFSDFSAG